MKTLVYGLGESGVCAVRALLASGTPPDDVLAADSRDTDGLRDTLADLAVEGRLGCGPEVLRDVARIVASPGISPRHDPVLKTAEEQGIFVASELSLGLELLSSLRPDARVLAITGTNGKTTVVDMISRILDSANLPHTVAGNSWRALSGCVEEVREREILVLEVSSFHLHYMTRGGFEVAALLNVRPDHMNWHSSLEEYAQDKLRIFEGQTAGDLALVSAADPVGRDAVGSLRAETLVIGEDGTEIENGRLLLRGDALLLESELPLVGRHNLENALFAAAAAQKVGASLESIRDGLRRYRMKPHRMEIVAERDGVLYVDDSKATNPAAVAVAICGFSRPVILILGGSEKDTDFSEIVPYLDLCRAVICQGAAGPRIAGFLNSVWREERVRLVADLGAAVRVSRGLARAGDVILLSPGCASYDQFSGYVERGEAFARLVAGGDPERQRTVGG